MKDNNRRYQYWKWRIILATMICYLFYYCGRFNLSICVGVIADEFGFSNKWVGLLSSSLILTYGIGQFINGNLGDRFGRLLMPIGAVVSCVCNWIFSFTPNISKATLSLMGWTNLTSVVFATMLVMWGINGYFQAMGMAPGGRLISNWWSHKERGLAMGLYTGAAGMSNVTIFLLASWLAGGYGWRAAFRYPPLLMAVVAVVFYLITKDYPEQVGLTSYNGAKRGQHGGSLKQYAAVLGNGNFLLSCIAIGLHHVSRWGLLSFLPKFFTDTTGWNVKKAGLMATALPLGMVVGALSGGYLSDRVFKGKRAPIICISLILCAIFTLLIPYVVLGDSSANPNE
ncbi:MAG: MFS transporter, partial [Sedimentisphaerales bacterium]|nr:MFS transporter [Sedimentisphaerales bacterium]